MMVDSLRTLLYPLGFIANFLFAGRFFVQWIQSEKQGKSVVSQAFWRLSFVANLAMCLHAYIQLQFPVCLIQALNATISWRNLNLMGKRVCRLNTTLRVMAASALLVSVLFFLQGTQEWMRPPTLPWTDSQASHASLTWHLAGLLGIVLFASRYWVQWWLAEKHRTSFLGKSFWWISCVGALFSLAYAIRLFDPVNILGFSLGLIPYIRNLMLMRKKTPPSIDTDSLFLFAGEQSGDVLGGNLVRALKHVSPSMRLYGVGGQEMQKAGMEITHPIERFQVMGITDVVKALPRLATDFRKIKQEILIKQPAGVVLIDYADFNMRLAGALRKGGYRGKIIHYVCPSVWAWRKNRVKTLAKTLDHLLSILPFEKECFTNTQLPVTYVGHPLVSAIDRHTYDPTWTFPKPLIALFPGSRRHEISLNLPLQLAAARKFAQKFAQGYTIAISVARPSLEDLICPLVDDSVILVPAEKRYELMQAADGALATSGTIILELGLHSVPTVATYQLATLNYLVGRYALRLRLPFYTLVNIICGKEVYPEFIHKELSADAIAEALKALLDNPAHCHQECAHLRTLLQCNDASHQAAQTILGTLS